MAAINITNDANTQSQVGGGRVNLRDSSGIPYVVTWNDAGDISLWKSNGTTPTSFSEVDADNNPSTENYKGVSACIDSDDVIHIAWIYDNVKVSQLMYVTVTSDTWGTPSTIVADLGEDTTGYTLGTAIAIDANDVPHIAYTSAGGKDGSDIKYANYVGGSWTSEIEVEGDTNGNICEFPDIAVDADNKPVISYINATDNDVGTAIGNSNDASSFTLQDIDTDGSQTAGEKTTSICVDSIGNHYVAYEDHGDGFIYIRKHAYDAADWATWVARSTGSDAGINPSIVADGEDVYVFYEDPVSHDIYYEKITDGSSWQGDNLLEENTYNTVKTKWALWVDNNSSGVNCGIPNKIGGFFDCSDGGPTDPDGDWSDDADAFNADTSNYASTTTGLGDEDNHELTGEGTTAPSSGPTITQVDVRVFHTAGVGGSGSCKIYTDSRGETLASISLPNPGLASWSSFNTLNTPTGGWTWAKLQALEATCYKGAGANALQIHSIQFVATVETQPAKSEIDYTFADEITDEEDIFWNSLSIGIVTSSKTIQAKANIVFTQTKTIQTKAFIDKAYDYEQSFDGLIDGDLDGQDNWGLSSAFEVQSVVAYTGKAIECVVGGNQGIGRTVDKFSSGEIFIAMRLDASATTGNEILFYFAPILKSYCFITIGGADKKVTIYNPATSEDDTITTLDDTNVWTVVHIEIQPMQYRARALKNGEWTAWSGWKELFYDNSHITSSVNFWYDQFSGTVKGYWDEISFTFGTIKNIKAKARIRILSITKIIQAKGRINVSQSKSIQAKANILAISTKTIQAKTNIKKTFSKTIQALACIQKINSKFILAKASIVLVKLKIIQTKARIKILTTHTIQAKTNIKASLVRTIQARGRIKVASITQTIQSKANILIIINKTIQTLARLQLTKTKTIQALGRITVAKSKTVQVLVNVLTTISKTIQAKGRIKILSVSYIIQAKARIQKSKEKTIQTLTRIEKINIKTVQAKARIIITKKRIIDAKVDILTIINKNIQAIACIQRIRIKTIQAKTRIVISKSKIIQVKANILAIQEKSIQVKARIKISKVKTIQTQARINLIRSKTINAKANIQTIVEKIKTISSQARIQLIKNKSIQARTNLLAIREKTISAKARIRLGAQKEIQSIARIERTESKLIQTKSRIEISKGKTVSALANILATQEKLIQARANLLATINQTIQTKARIKILSVSYIIQSLARIEQTRIKSIQAKARIKISKSKTIQVKANILSTQEKTISAKARIRLGTQKEIQVIARIELTENKSIQTKARIVIIKIKTIQVKANLSSVQEKLIQSKANILSIINKSIQVKARIRLGTQNEIQAIARIKSTESKLIQAKANITIKRIAYPWQRKHWYDGVRYWRASYDPANDRIMFEYSPDLSSWTENVSARISDANVSSDFSIWGNGSYLYIVYSNGEDILGRKAKAYPAINFVWFDSSIIYDGSDDLGKYIYPNIAYDGNENRLNVLATLQLDANNNYVLYNKRTIAANQVPSEATAKHELVASQADEVFGTIRRNTDAVTGSLIAVWKKGTAIQSAYRNGTDNANDWEADQDIAIGKAGTTQAICVEHSQIGGDTVLIYIDSNGKAHSKNRLAGSGQSWNEEGVLDDDTNCRYPCIGEHAVDHFHLIWLDNDDHIRERIYDVGIDTWNPILANPPSDRATKPGAKWLIISDETPRIHCCWEEPDNSIDCLELLFNAEPTKPTDLETEGATNPFGVIDLTPELTGLFHDTDIGDKSRQYQIEVRTSAENFVSAFQLTDLENMAVSGVSFGANGKITVYGLGDVNPEGGYLESGGFTDSNVFSEARNILIIFNDIVCLDGATVTLTYDGSQTLIVHLHAMSSPDEHGGFITSDGSAWHDSYFSILGYVNPAIQWLMSQADFSVQPGDGERCEEISYEGNTLKLNGNIYYWKIRMKDLAGAWSPWSDELASFQVATEKNIQVKANIKVTQEKTIQTKARIKILSVTHIIQTKASIKVIKEKTIQIKTNIKQEVNKTVNVLSRIKISKTSIIYTKARITQFRNKTINTIGDIKRISESNILTKANIKLTIEKQILVKCDIVIIYIRTVQTKARIAILSNTRLIQAKGVIFSSSVKKIDVKAKIQRFGEKTISTKAYITHKWTQTINVNANIKQFNVSKTANVKGRIKIIKITTITVKAKIKAYFRKIKIKEKIDIKYKIKEKVDIKIKIKEIKEKVINSQDKISSPIIDITDIISSDNKKPIEIFTD